LNLEQQHSSALSRSSPTAPNVELRRPLCECLLGHRPTTLRAPPRRTLSRFISERRFQPLLYRHTPPRRIFQRAAAQLRADSAQSTSFNSCDWSQLRHGSTFVRSFPFEAMALLRRRFLCLQATRVGGSLQSQSPTRRPNPTRRAGALRVHHHLRGCGNAHLKALV